MVINWYGNGCFKITSGGVTILIDPESNRFKGDVVLKTTQPLPLAARHPDEIVGPGEYEIKNVEIEGYPATPETGAGKTALATIYKVTTEDLRLCFFGSPAKLPDGSILEKLGEVDILFLAPGNAPAVKQLNPKIVVPSFFKNVKELAKAFDQKIEEEEHLTIKQKDLPANIKIIALKNA